MNKLMLANKFLIAISLVFLFSAVSFGQTATTQEWFVADKQVDCTGVAPQKCLVVREVNSTDWKYLYRQIENFKFRDGYTQKISVRIAPRQIVPADAAALSYRLIKVLSRSKTDGNTFEEAQRQMKNQKTLLLGDDKWMLSEIDGAKAETDTAFIQFDARNKRFTAKVCNSIGGSFDLNGVNLKLTNAFSTKMACREPLGSTEITFLTALGKVTRAEQSGNALILFAGNTAVLRFEVESKSASLDKTLEKTKWVLSALENNKIVPKGNIPFLQFDREKMSFSGFSGCNRIFGKYEESDGKTLKFGAVAATRMACLDPESQKIETDMTAALANVDRYEINNGALKLYAGDKILLKLLALGR